MIPKFAVNVLDSQSSTRNTRLAATVAAFGVPLKPENPWSTSKGDGIEGTRVTWHFMEESPSGVRPSKLIKVWTDDIWLATNPNHPLAAVVEAFHQYDELLAITRGDHARKPETRGAPSCITTCTRQAATMLAVGHRFLGWSKHGDKYGWHFDQSAAIDLAAYDGYANAHTLPDTNLCLVRAALTNHQQMVGWVKSIQFARVQHKGRFALIGVDSSQAQINQIEKILYR